MVADPRTTLARPGGETESGGLEKTLTYLDGEWVEGNPPIWGPRTHAIWLSSVVFDGARAIAGKTPDLELHCARCVESRR